MIKQHLWLIDEEFRQNPRNQRLFLQILKAPQGVTRTLRRMNTYGVLGLYIPAFGRIVGRMQYDLFHAYTVDAHTLFVVENLRRFSLPRFDDEFPSCSALMQSLQKPEIAYLAGLFHDIAKGRGGDHSELGSVDAQAFCLEHGMSRYDARLVAWLVQHHLLLSVTAQKEGPQRSSPSSTSLRRPSATRPTSSYLYRPHGLRTSVERNPKIWNSWKDTLFSGSFTKLTKRALRRGLAHAIDADELVDGDSSVGQERCCANPASGSKIGRVGRNLGELHAKITFLRHRPEEVAWHTRVLTQTTDEHRLHPRRRE